MNKLKILTSLSLFQIFGLTVFPISPIFVVDVAKLFERAASLAFIENSPPSIF